MTSVVERETSSGLHVPPHSVEAEESVLGAVLMSAEAANIALEKLHAEDFYRPVNQSVFQAIQDLFDANQPIDAVTVSEALRRTGMLERAGGVGFLTRLIDTVPAASNVEYYAGIVEEHALRRRLMRVGGDLGTFATAMDEPISQVLDRSEQAVFTVSERRIGDGLAPIDPLLGPAIEKAEELNRLGAEVTGIPTGFRDLDNKLAGLHPTNLLIIAARPGMGKCVSASTEIVDPKTGALTTIGDMVQQRADHGTHHVLALDPDGLRFNVGAPIEYHDNGVRETYRLTTRLGRTITATDNHPFLTLNGWTELRDLTPGDAIAVPRTVDAFGVDLMHDGHVALLGYLIGDGSMTQRPPYVTNTNPRIVQDVKRWSKAIGCDGRSRVRDNGATVISIVPAARPSVREVADLAGAEVDEAARALRGDHRVSRGVANRVEAAAGELGYIGRKSPFIEFLDDLGLMGCAAHDKFVPDVIFRLPKRQIALFLSRLYAADGSAWTSGDLYRIEYSTVSERLARGVQHLLSRFGVVAKLRRRLVKYDGGRRTAWDVSFQDPDSVRAFCESITIFSKEAQQQAVFDAANSRSVDQAHHSLLPMEVWDVVLAEKGDRTWASISTATGRPSNHNWHVRRRRLSRRLVGELASALDSDRLRALATSEVVWDPIVSIEPVGLEQTYDITVPQHHNFIANDIVVHNSTLALNVAQNVAVQDHPVAIFSLEMSREEVVSRMLCSTGRIDSQKLRTGRLSESDFSKLSNAASTLYKRPIFVDDSPGLTVTEIRAKCRRMRRKPGLGLVVIDYLQLMQGSGGENRQQEIAEISRNLKNLARELDVPVIALSQLNRQLESREDKRPRLADLRESGSLEQDADVVMFIYRHDYYHPEAQETRGIAEVAVAKHRQGSTGKVDMTFLPEFTLFADMGRDTAVM
ncbi:MAG: replicative DNA helicase [Acidimicrobiia bacterium]|nr:replicative DNA helicase [Acidimicrobiia bacterium]